MSDVFFARLTKDNPLSEHDQGFSASLVYSYLLKKTRFNKAVSAYQISKYLDLPQTYTVKPAIDLLVSLGLATIQNKTVIANPPPDGWYVAKKEPSEHWADGFAYFPIAISFSVLTTRQNAIYMAIKARPNQTQTWYALVLGLHRSTVVKTLNKLRRMGLVATNATVANPVMPDKWKNIWTKDKAKTAKKSIVPVFATPEELPAKTEKPVLQNENAIPAPAPAKTEKQVFQNSILEKSDFEKLRPKNPEIISDVAPAANRLTAALLTCNYSEADCIDVLNLIFKSILIWKNSQVFNEVFNVMPQIVKIAEATTRSNRAQSKFFGKNSKGILVSEIENAQEQLQTAMQHKDPDSEFILWEYTPRNMSV